MVVVLLVTDSVAEAILTVDITNQVKDIIGQELVDRKLATFEVDIPAITRVVAKVGDIVVVNHLVKWVKHIADLELVVSVEAVVVNIALSVAQLELVATLETVLTLAGKMTEAQSIFHPLYRLNLNRISTTVNLLKE